MDHLKILRSNKENVANIYVNNKKHGIWHKCVPISNSKSITDFVYYYEHGKLIKTEIYLNGSLRNTL
jgi:antitoxin component YwqK of YwqJK toxin-antitoxin module